MHQNKPNLLERIQDQTLASADQFLKHMFTALDDLFYELSKRASTNNEANLYFESMRELRIKKNEVCELFLAEINSNFDELTSPPPSLNQVHQETHLAMVDGDDLEIDIARKGMASRTQDTFKKELYEIATRLNHVILQTEITEKNIPISPDKVSDAFVRACQDTLELNIKTRLIVFKLFEKHVLQQCK